MAELTLSFLSYSAPDNFLQGQAFKKQKILENTKFELNLNLFLKSSKAWSTHVEIGTTQHNI